MAWYDIVVVGPSPIPSGQNDEIQLLEHQLG
jgi:hypothetical protein